MISPKSTTTLSEKQTFKTDQTANIIKSEEVVVEGKPWTDTLYSHHSWKEGQARNVFLQGVPIKVSLSATKRQGRVSNPVSQVIYKVNVEHGQWQWTVEKRFTNFIGLHT